MATRNTAKNNERQFLIECIQLYRDLPALWQIKSKVYHDRDKKNIAYDLLLAKYNEMFPHATKEDVKKKFNSLRTNYRKELKKYLSSMQSGTSTYEPTLWYFEEMNFLHDQELPSVSSTDTDKTAAADEENEEQIPRTKLQLRKCGANIKTRRKQALVLRKRKRMKTDSGLCQDIELKFACNSDSLKQESAWPDSPSTGWPEEGAEVEENVELDDPHSEPLVYVTVPTESPGHSGAGSYLSDYSPSETQASRNLRSQVITEEFVHRDHYKRMQERHEELHKLKIAERTWLVKAAEHQYHRTRLERESFEELLRCNQAKRELAELCLANAKINNEC